MLSLLKMVNGMAKRTGLPEAADHGSEKQMKPPGGYYKGGKSGLGRFPANSFILDAYGAAVTFAQIASDEQSYIRQ